MKRRTLLFGAAAVAVAWSRLVWARGVENQRKADHVSGGGEARIRDFRYRGL